jgi:multiple sugar transport system ATP-binding protein
MPLVSPWALMRRGAAIRPAATRLGTTTVYVTHDQVEAMTLGDRVCVFRDGQLQQVDTPQTLFDAPANLFVAGFIGSPAMNFVLADLIRDDGPAVSFAGFKLPVPASVLAGKAGLEEYVGRKVIIGIRPSDFEDAAFGDADRPRIGAVDTSRLHFFDPASGESIGHPAIGRG